MITLRFIYYTLFLPSSRLLKKNTLNPFSLSPLFTLRVTVSEVLCTDLNCFRAEVPHSFKVFTGMKSCSEAHRHTRGGWTLLSGVETCLACQWAPGVQRNEADNQCSDTGVGKLPDAVYVNKVAPYSLTPVHVCSARGGAERLPRRPWRPQAYHLAFPENSQLWRNLWLNFC